MLDVHATFEDFIEANDEERSAFRLSYPTLYASFDALRKQEEDFDLVDDLTFYETPEGESIMISGEPDDDFFDANYDSYEDYLNHKK